MNLSEKTSALITELIAQAGIKNPIVGIEETDDTIKIWLLAHATPLVLQKPKQPAPAKTRKRRE